MLSEAKHPFPVRHGFFAVRAQNDSGEAFSATPLGKASVPGLTRRSFLKGAGIGSLGLASLPTLGSALAGKAFAGDLLGIHLVTISQPPGQPAATPEKPNDWLVVAGSGHVHGDALMGDGSFVHVLVPGPSVPPPWDIAGYGTWRFTKLTSWDSIGAGAGLAAGVLDCWIELDIKGGPLAGQMAALPAQIVCNIEPAGLVTGKQEGFYVQNTPVGDLEPITLPGGFPLGLTAFTTM